MERLEMLDNKVKVINRYMMNDQEQANRHFQSASYKRGSLKGYMLFLFID